MNYQAKPRWTARQVQFLKDNAYTMRDEDIATALGRTLKSVRRKRENLEMKKACGRGIVKKYEAVVNPYQSPSSPPMG